MGVYLLIVVGAIVRVTDSGLGCPDWPLCHGRFLPPADPAAIVEYSHRTLAAIVSAMLVATIIGAWLHQRTVRLVFVPLNVVAGLLVVQIPFGAVTVRLELPPTVVLIHLSIALVMMGLAILAAMTAALGPGSLDRGTRSHAIPPSRASTGGYPRMVAVSLLAVFVLLLTGGLTRASGASWVCLGFPGCDGARSFLDPLVALHVLHRVSATVVGCLLIYQAYSLRKTHRHDRRVATCATLAAVAVVLQFAFGVGQVAFGARPVFQILHVAGGAATWGIVVALAVLVYQDMLRRQSASSAPPTGAVGTPNRDVEYAQVR